MDNYLLNVKSVYNFLSSTITIADYVKFGQKHYFSALSLVDNKVMYCYPEFYFACQQANIKPIFGLEFVVKHEQLLINVVLIAQNYAGYNNLVKISSLLNTQAETWLAWEQCQTHMDDCFLVVTIDQNNLAFADLLRKHLFWKQTFIALHEHNWQARMHYEKRFTSAKCLWMEPTISLNTNDETVLTFLHCLRKNSKYKTQQPITYVDYFAQLDLINTSKQLMHNHQQLMNVCDVVFPASLQTQKIAAPYYLKTKDSATVLAKICYEKLHQLFVNKIPLNYVTRFRYEFQILRTKGFLNYFLLVADYVQYAKQHNIYVGPGRGSVAGSLIAYLLGITMIDPLAYNLIFERFLNPSRQDMPDIDIDFEDVQRSDIFLYLQAKYGMHYVANISTFQNIGFKMAVRDVFRVFDYPITIADKITKLIASDDNFHFTQALAHNKLLCDYKRHYETAFHIIERIIGFPRQTGTHAAGIIIADRSLNDYIPIRHGANNIIQSQYGMHYLKSFGLIKMDILGLRNLTLLKEMIKIIAQKENIHYDLETLDRHDQKTFTLLRKGDTLGLFQLESPGMTKLLLKMQVVSLNDLSAVLALYRPGAMQNIDRYLQARKQGLQVKTRLERVIAQISGDTYGFLIYQEQIMMLASVIAQFDLAKADHLRKAMSKKDHALILSLKKDFYTQGATNGYNQQELDYSWQLIEQFAAYGFNKSHSISYALIGYWMAFFKANWPQYFYTTMLNYMTNSASQTKIYLDALRQAGLKIAPPSVNYLHSNCYSIIKNTVFLPLQLIKQIGQQTANAIADERAGNGEFQDVFDFWNRLAQQRFNKKQFEALVCSGALACFDINQETLLANFFVLQDYQKVVYYNNELITGVATPLLTEQAPTKPSLYWIHKQQEYFGFYLNDHPVALLRQQYNLNNKITFLNAVGSKPVFIVALITSCSFIHDKNNHKMAFLNITDETAQISVVLFADMFRKNPNIQENDFLLAKIKKQSHGHKNNYDLLEMKIIPASKLGNLISTLFEKIKSIKKKNKN